MMVDQLPKQALFAAGRRACFILLFLLALPPCLETGWCDRRALIVGISEYPDPSSRLKGAANDARQYTQLLRDSFGFAPQSITLLLDSEATGARMRQELQRLSTPTGSGDVVVFAFSGHGTRIKDVNGDEEDGYDEALVPYDYRENTASSVILDDEIAGYISSSPGSTWVFFLDSCFSGTGTRNLEYIPYAANRMKFLPMSFGQSSNPGAGGTSEDPWGLNPPTLAQRSLSAAHQKSPFSDLFSGSTRQSAQPGQDNVALFAACQAYEPAWDSCDQDVCNGLFTSHLLKGLSSGVVIPGRTTFGDLAGYFNRTLEKLDSQGQTLVASGSPVRQTPYVEVPVSMSGQILLSLPVLQPTPIPNWPSVGPTPALPYSSPTAAPANPPGSTYRVAIRLGENKGIYYEGETLRICVESNRDGRLILLSKTADSKIVQLFPNLYHSDNRIFAGSPLWVPAGGEFRLRVGEPYGQEEIWAIVSERPLDLPIIQSIPQSGVTPFRVMSPEQGHSLERSLGERGIHVEPGGAASTGATGEFGTDRVLIETRPNY